MPKSSQKGPRTPPLFIDKSQKKHAEILTKKEIIEKNYVRNCPKRPFFGPFFRHNIPIFLYVGARAYPGGLNLIVGN